MGTLNGKTALVTGGCGGIGTAICKRFAAEGVNVITTYIDERKIPAWKEALGTNAAAFRCDVSSYDDCVNLREQISAEFDSVDIVVNNAGITRDGSFKKQTAETWNAVIATNLDSLFNISHQFVTDMARRGFGRVVNISSINGQKGQFGQTNYSAAKAGVHGFTMALAQEVARKGVTVNTVSPGYIATEMVMAVPEDVRNQIIAGIPVGRLGEPEEIAALVAFLCSEEAGFITGANLAANGGQHMH
jgi:acetoacetyl-CoA reductase